MAYKLPKDDDGVRYHGVVDENDENPGQFMYGLDENGNKRIIRTDEQGNVLTRVTGSNVGYSTETKPTGKKGDAFLELDTPNVYIFDGAEWVKI